MTKRDPDPHRGTGRTTRQMREAPKNALFVWCNDAVSYAKALAYYAGRADLEILPYSVLCGGAHRLRGAARPIVIDHAAVPTREAEEGFIAAEMMGWRYEIRPLWQREPTRNQSVLSHSPI